MFYNLMCCVIMHITSCYFSTGNVILLFHLKFWRYFYLTVWTALNYFQSKTWSVLHIYDYMRFTVVDVPAKNFLKFMFWDELSEVSDEECRAGRGGVRGVRVGPAVRRHGRARWAQRGRRQHARAQRQGCLDIITMIIRSKLLVKFDLHKKPHLLSVLAFCVLRVMCAQCRSSLCALCREFFCYIERKMLGCSIHT